MQGVWTALVTPFTDSNEIDLPAFKRILKDQKEAGVSGVVPCGTTGESPTLTQAEKKTLISTTVSELKGTGVKVMAGTGTNNTVETLEMSVWASHQGVDGILVVTPYYNKPSQAGLEAHFLAVANAVTCEVIPYNVPGRTSVSMTAETLVRLSKHPKIRTVKEATGNTAFASEILDLAALNQTGLDILSGDDATYLSLLSVGGAGAISVASNLFPRAMVGIQNAMKAGRPKEALEIHRQFYPLFRDLFLESNPVPIKYAMEYAGWCNARVRPPLAPLLPSNIEKLRMSLNRCGIVSGKPM